MKKEIALSLKAEADNVAAKMSVADRPNNFNSERFEVEEIAPLSEVVAAVTFAKSGGKKVLAVFYYHRDRWWNFFPTDSLLLGFYNLQGIKEAIEKENFPINLKEE